MPVRKKVPNKKTPHRSSTTISVLDYSTDMFEEKVVHKVSDCHLFKHTPTVSWIHVDRIKDKKMLEVIGACFDLHPLVLEDIQQTNQRPKIEDYGHYVYIVLQIIRLTDPLSCRMETEQISIILGEHYVLSFSEHPNAIFRPIEEKIRLGNNRIRTQGPDYLAYKLVDVVVDQYFSVLESVGEHIEGKEDRLFKHLDKKTLHEIHALRRELLLMRRAVWPLREVIGNMERREVQFITESTSVYLRDLYDHIFQVMDTIDTYRDMVGGLLELYLSSSSNKLNEVMKVLTMIATIFIPLTFVAGVYGMNFKHMPELDSPFGYPAVLVLMATMAFFMLRYFRRKKWM